MSPNRHMRQSRISDLHIYLPEPDRSEIIAWAQSEGRTAGNLVKYIVRQALASRDAGEGATSAKPNEPVKRTMSKG